MLTPHLQAIPFADTHIYIYTPCFFQVVHADTHINEQLLCTGKLGLVRKLQIYMFIACFCLEPKIKGEYWQTNFFY